jgi:hypothetical protein
MKVGDRIRVSQSVVVYHHPQNKQKPLDIKGREGEIIEIIDSSISANLPIVVKFEPKFNAHFREDELEVI